jgi:hypothetical protein
MLFWPRPDLTGWGQIRQGSSIAWIETPPVAGRCQNEASLTISGPISGSGGGRSTWPWSMVRARSAGPHQAPIGRDLRHRQRMGMWRRTRAGRHDGLLVRQSLRNTPCWNGPADRHRTNPRPPCFPWLSVAGDRVYGLRRPIEPGGRCCMRGACAHATGDGGRRKDLRGADAAGHERGHSSRKGRSWPRRS